MNDAELFERFSAGKLSLPAADIDFNSLPWNKHPVFDGVEIKNIVTSAHTNGEFSFHLVRIAPNKKIGLHVHEKQLETHEVISGKGICLNDGVEIEYGPGTISIMPMNVKHEVIAGEEGLCLFAKFFPASG